MVGMVQRVVSKKNREVRGIGLRSKVPRLVSPSPYPTLSPSLPTYFFPRLWLRTSFHYLNAWNGLTVRVDRRLQCLQRKPTNGCHFTTILSPACSSLTKSTLTTFFSFIVCFQDYFGSSLETGSSLVRILSLVFKATAMPFSSVILRRVLFESWKSNPRPSFL